MGSGLAIAACFGLIGYLFWLDRGRSPNVSGATWIPFFWMAFAGSRFASEWWHLGPPSAMSLTTYSEGSAFDRNVFVLLIIAGLLVLATRRVRLNEFARQNPWLFIFFAYAALSVLWSDYPDLAIKRWVKAVGNLVMALIFLTDKRPFDALGIVLRRLAIVLIPLSVLFIRYFPDIGRSYHMGVAMLTGVALQKNTLGLLCMLSATYFSWIVLLAPSKFDHQAYRPHRNTLLILAPMIAYLLYVARSATALAVAIGIMTLFAVARLSPFLRRPTRILAYGAILSVAFVFSDYAFDVQNTIVKLLGRNPDLTDRRPLWDLVVEQVPNRWVGAGYETFWAGDRLQEIWRRLGDVSVIQAHNGYIDLYASLGYVGLALLGAAMLQGMIQVRRSLPTAYAHSLMKLALIMIALVYNYTEASIKPLNNVFVLLIFALLDPPTVAGNHQHPPGTAISRTLAYPARVAGARTSPRTRRI